LLRSTSVEPRTVRALFGSHKGETVIFWVLVISIGLSFWVQYARTVRGSTLVERNKDYVQAARLIGLSKTTILFRHVLPNVMGPVLVIATINLALAIITEATLSFLGVGLPPTTPSLGTLIRVGNEFLFSGEWWVVIFPGIALAALVLAVNMLGDWLRDALNPKLQ
jgi:peptide/nickel transport system permease protein